LALRHHSDGVLLNLGVSCCPSWSIDNSIFSLALTTGIGEHPATPAKSEVT
jgi:hypothetical protein